LSQGLNKNKKHESYAKPGEFVKVKPFEKEHGMLEIGKEACIAKQYKSLHKNMECWKWFEKRWQKAFKPLQEYYINCRVDCALNSLKIV